jgi:enterochelin esterase-like enzyme
MNRRTHLLWLGVALSAISAQETFAQETSDPVWVTDAIKAPGVSFHTFESETIRRLVSFHLYSPRAYAADPARRFPVVYWLHGSGGGQQGVAPLARLFEAAIEARRIPPCLIVFVNGLRMGMYVDRRDGSAPVESVIVRDLIPHIDAGWRTIASRDGRMLDGFSMGGYGAGRLGFRYPDLFANVSMMGAGPLQERLTDTPRASRRQAEDLLRRVYGDDQTFFQEVSPRRYAERNAETIARTTRLRLVVGDRDETFANNSAFHDHLTRLTIPHEWIVLPGVGHDPLAVITALGDRNWAFYRSAFGQPD